MTGSVVPQVSPWGDGQAELLLASLLASLSQMAEVHPGGNLGASLCLHFRRINLFTNVQELLSAFLAPLDGLWVCETITMGLYQVHSPQPGMESHGLARKGEHRKWLPPCWLHGG